MRFVVVGAGPGGNVAANFAARFGAEVTVVEAELIGGGAHLWDCIPSKAMVATGGLLGLMQRADYYGLDIGDDGTRVDGAHIWERIQGISRRLSASFAEILDSQGVRVVAGEARFLDANTVATTPGGDGGGGAGERIDFDAALISTGSRPRVPEWAAVDGERILTTRQAYNLPEIPTHVVVIGSGVTGVEFAHIFSTYGAEVSLVVSRQQVLPHKDPEVAAALEEDFLRRNVRLLKGARTVGIDRDGDGVVVHLDDGRRVAGSHALLAIGSVPNTEALDLDAAGVKTDGGYVTVNDYCQTNVPHIYAAGDVSGRLPLSSVAAAQGRKVAHHVMGRPVVPLDYKRVAQAIFTEPEIASVGLEEAEAASLGRKVRITKVPFSANPKALIEGDFRGFVKIVSDPYTGVVLGGSIVGRHAAELIGVLALAVRARLKVTDLDETVMVHPSLVESLADAAE